MKRKIFYFLLTLLLIAIYSGIKPLLQNHHLDSTGINR
jgi:hypothetical protein